MAYGKLKVDSITFTDGGTDTTVSVSGLVQNPTFSGDITVTGTISGSVVQGGTTVSGATVTGTAGEFGTVTGNTAGFTTVTGTTVTGTTANFTSGVFTSLSGTTATVTSGVFASGTAAAPSVSVGTTNNGLYSPGTDEVAISTNGTGRLFVDSSGNVGLGTSTTSGNLDVRGLSGTTIIRAVGVDSNGNADVEIFSTGTTGNSRLFFADTAAQSGSIIYRHSDNSFTFATNGGAADVVIDSSGNVGIGDTGPSETLTVKGASSVDPFSVSGPSSEFLRVDDGGRLLVNTSSSTGDEKLTVLGSAYFGAGSNTVTLANGATGTIITPPRGYSYINISYDQTTSGGLLVLVFATTSTLTVVSTVDDRSAAAYSVAASGRDLQVTNSAGTTAIFYASCMSLLHANG